MRHLLPLIPWIAIPFLMPRAAMAQNSDLSFLLGVYWPRGEVVTAPSTYIHGSVGASVQLNYAGQVIQKAVDLYIEVPVVISVQNTGTVTSTSVTSSTGPDVFFTPGVRLKISPQSRISFYGALGGGIASFSTDRIVSGKSTTITSGRTNSGALDFGGGIDFRLTRLLSLRFDARDFVTQAGLGGSVGRHHGIYEFGVVFHF